MDPELSQISRAGTELLQDLSTYRPGSAVSERFIAALTTISSLDGESEMALRSELVRRAASKHLISAMAGCKDIKVQCKAAVALGSLAMPPSAAALLLMDPHAELMLSRLVLVPPARRTVDRALLVH